jgi:hypothetical protein
LATAAGGTGNGAGLTEGAAGLVFFAGSSIPPEP